MAALASQEDVLARWTAACSPQRDGGFGYRHALLRDAALADIAEPPRRGHEELAGALRGPAAETARHLRLAGRDDLAAGRLRGRRVAPRRGAVDEAAEFLREARAAPRRRRAHGRARGRAGLQRPPGRRRGRAADDAPAAGAVRARRARRRPRRAARWYSGALCRPSEAMPRRRGVRSPSSTGRRRRSRAARQCAARRLGARSRRGPDAAERCSPSSRRSVTDPDVALRAPHLRAFGALLARGPARRGRGGFVHRRGGGAEPGPRLQRRANLACVAVAAGGHEHALACADRGVADHARDAERSRRLHALRAKLLARLGRHEAAREAATARASSPRGAAGPSLVALADHDAGMIACAAGDHGARGALLGARSPATRPSSGHARLAIAEALARLGRADDAEAELRESRRSPSAPATAPTALVARITHVQALVARARGDEVLAERRLQEAERRGGARRRGAGASTSPRSSTSAARRSAASSSRRASSSASRSFDVPAGSARAAVR